MAEGIIISAQPRAGQGTAEARRLRHKGKIPAIVYGRRQEPQAIELDAHDFEQLLRHHASEHLIIDLKVGDEPVTKVLLRAIQHHPVSGHVLHVDFHAVSMTETLKISIPIELEGEAVGVTQQGGVLEQLVREIEVECLPTDIMERIGVDISGLHIGDMLSVADVKVDTNKYTIITPSDLAIAAVAAPRVQEEPAEAEEEEAAEGEGAAEAGEEEPAEAS